MALWACWIYCPWGFFWMVAKTCTHRLVQTHKTMKFWAKFWRKSRHGSTQLLVSAQTAARSMNWGSRTLARQFHTKHLLCPSNCLLDPQPARTFSTEFLTKITHTHTNHKIHRLPSPAALEMEFPGAEMLLECKKGHLSKALLHTTSPSFTVMPGGKRTSPKQSPELCWWVTHNSTEGSQGTFTGEGKANMEKVYHSGKSNNWPYLCVQNQR